MRSPASPPDRDAPGKSTAATARMARQKAALKANMARRKAQVTARSATDAPGETESKDQG